MKLNLLLIPLMASVMALYSCRHADASGKDDGRLEETSPECMVRFEKSSGKEFFNVAMRDEYRKNIWFVFRVSHYVNDEPLQYMDLWRVDWAYQGRYDGETGTMENILDKILTDGESECVLKDYGENLNTSSHIDTYDFTGGFHGDERIDLEEGCGVEFYIDGRLLSRDELAGSFGWRECSGFRYVQKSTLHKTALKVDSCPVESDHHVIADHLKSTVFGNSGYVTENTLRMRDEIDFYWYCGICCVGTSVADKGCNESMQAVTFDRSGANRLDWTGMCEYYAWDNDAGIEVHVKSNVVSGASDDQCRMFIWDTANYAKFYRRYPANGALRTSTGDEFSSMMSVRFSTR